MNDNTFTPNTGTRALSRTFNVLSVTRECGVTTDVEYVTINLTRTDSGLTAQINGQAAELERAVATIRRVYAARRVRRKTKASNKSSAPTAKTCQSKA